MNTSISCYLNPLTNQIIAAPPPSLVPSVILPPINPFLQNLSMANFINGMPQQNNLQNYFLTNNPLSAPINPLQFLPNNNIYNSISNISSLQLPSHVNTFNINSPPIANNMFTNNNNLNAVNIAATKVQYPFTNQQITQSFTPITGESLVPKSLDPKLVKKRPKNHNPNMAKKRKIPELSNNPSNSNVDAGQGIATTTENINEMSSNHASKIKSSKTIVDKTSIYVGPVDNNDKPHGQGSLHLLQKNEHYLGEFCHGIKSGAGRLITPTYSLKGLFNEDFPSGMMEYEDETSTIVGKMEKGKFVGNCSQKIKGTLEQYQGPFFKYERQGKGRLDGQDFYFEGFFCHNKKIFGKIVNKNTQEIAYEGPFIEDHPVDNTQNYIKYENNYIFVHDTKKTIITESGTCYFGQTNNHMKHGTGIFYLANGRIYTGLFINDIMHDMGKMEVDDGHYIGQFSNDEWNGLGTFYPNNGNPPIKGSWRKGEFISK